jgi:transcription elongation factor Elf1
MQLTFTCFRCGQTHSGDFPDAKTIWGSDPKLRQGAERPIMGYLVNCPHCGATNMVPPKPQT